MAAADGQVIEANATDSWGYSWGYYVLIYHNGTYSTRYAHMSSVAVSTGQYVTAGTIIGYEGNTGNSFGAHLHFEVYENGTRVNPAGSCSNTGKALRQAGRFFHARPFLDKGRRLPL